MSMRLTKEVLPPRQPPGETAVLMSEAQVRASITHAIWLAAALVGLASVAARILEMQL